MTTSRFHPEYIFAPTAQQMGIGEHRLRELAEQGCVRRIPYGKSTLYHRDDVEHLLGRRPPQCQAPTRAPFNPPKQQPAPFNPVHAPVRYGQ
jgi:hypothetical protein